MNHLKTIAEIAFFKGKPHDIPYNVAYLVISFIFVLFIGITAVDQADKISNPGSYIFVQFAIIGLFFYLILLANGKVSRFVQSATAVYGIIALSQTIAFILIFLLKANGAALLISLWSAAVQIYIIRETLECKTIKAFALYAAIQFSTNMLLLVLFPELIEILQNAMQQPTQVSS